MSYVEDAHNELLAALHYLTPQELAIVERAFDVAQKAHGPQQRKSGQPYIVHPLAIAHMLAQLQMDAATIAAALLHDVLEDTPITYAQMEAEFGAEISRLVLGVTKLSADVQTLKKIRARISDDLTYEENEAASLVNLLVTMAADLRVMAIKLYDRLHNMRTIRWLKPVRQRQIAQETLELFVPLAARLGIWRLKQQLADACLRVLEPETYAEIEELLQARTQLLTRDVEDVLTQLRLKLADAGIPATVTAFPEHVSDLSQDIQERGWENARTYDGLRIRVCVDTITQCYMALGSIHNLWSPVQGRIKDFIAAPRETFYRSLDTLVIGLHGHPVEIYIRTHEMQQITDYGVLVYLQRQPEDQKKTLPSPELPWLDEMAELPDDDPSTFLNLFKSEIAPERIRVFTPKGDVKELPAGSTPVDFAYAVHTGIGDRCRRALVNNRQVPLNTPLRNGDQVEIVKSIQPGPDRVWLDEDLEYTHTPYTLRHIRRWFAHQPHEVLIEQGRALLEKEIRCWGACDGWTAADVERLARQRGLTVEDFCLQVGRGDISARELGYFVLNEVLGHPQDHPGLLSLEVQVTDRALLLRDACQIVADDNVNLYDAWGKAAQETNLAVIHLTLDASQLRKIVRIAHRLEQMRSALQVQRTAYGERNND
ncbi:MAG: (p)ppGpp synthetase [Chloroflexi bacterium]|nr:MAG: (p)ppGpp synthetase [Chloroflexota bacterium]